MLTAVDERLEVFLTWCGLAWSAIPWKQHANLTKEWDALYGNTAHWVCHRHGAKARYEYALQTAESFLIVPFLGSTAGVHSIGKRRPRKAAYECHGAGASPDLSAFADTDFFIVPADFSWTMIHTHEDDDWDGPYFVRKEWLGPSNRRLSRRT